MPIATDLREARIGQISITVHDLWTERWFSTRKAGLKHLFTVPKLSFFNCGGIRLMLGVPESLSLTTRARCCTSPSMISRQFLPACRGWSSIRRAATLDREDGQL